MKLLTICALIGLIGCSSASLARDLAPVLGLLQPLLSGLGAGLQNGAGDVQAAVQNVGATANQLLGGVGSIAGETVAGAGQTVGQVPGGVEETVKTIDNSPGIIGSVDRAAFGNPEYDNFDSYGFGDSLYDY